MLAKLALRNVRRSAKDYAVYFVTLVFGVAVFYAFNSLDSQSVLFDIRNNAAGRMLALTNYFLGIFSVAVALVLAFLVAYANRFIIKRRKREFGTYLLLGMGAPKVSTVLFFEMLAVGLVSLAVGLVMGMVLSQGLAFATAALMGTTMTRYRFVVSTDAIVSTFACFAVLFAATLVMNIAFVSRRKLGDLLTARSENAKEGRIPTWARVAGFVAALALLAVSYWMLWHNQFSEMNSEFIACTCLMVAGTVLLFWSGSTIALMLARRAEDFYHKDLHAFTARQISSRIGAAFASLSIVCVMLFFALSTVSIGFGVRAIFVGDVEQTTQYDVTMFAEPSTPAETDMAAAIAAANPAWNDLMRATAQLDSYEEPGVTWGAVLDQAGIDISSMSPSELFESSALTIMGIGQFNAVRALIGEPAIQMAEDRYLINNTFAETEPLAAMMREQEAPLTIAGIELTAAPDAVAMETRTGAISASGLEIIVPDAVIDALRTQGIIPATSILDSMYSCSRIEGDARLSEVLASAYPSDEEIDPNSRDYPTPPSGWPYANVYTAEYMIAQAGGLKLLITYLAIYIGFVLLVTTAAILAIQQLSETADSVGRYQRLSSLGCDRDMVLGSLRTQSVLYFLVPLAVALVHSVYAVHVMDVGLFSAFGIDPVEGIAITGGLVLVIYGCYMLVTYLASRHVVCEACGF